MKENPVLRKSVEELAVSKEFALMAKTNSFYCLQDVLDSPLYKLHKLPDSGYRMVTEFINVLDSYNLKHLAGR